jgi:hypothetical protein
VTAVACDVSNAVIELGSNATVTVATGIGVTVIVAVPLCPSLVAMITAAPGDIAVTRPVAETAATAGLSDSHVTVRPVSTLFWASLSAAVSCSVLPATIFGAAGLTVTVATGARMTVSGVLPFFPSLVAEMCAVPSDTAVTRPAEDTVATAVLSELQAIERPVNTPPFASCSVAAACVV